LGHILLIRLSIWNIINPPDIKIFIEITKIQTVLFQIEWNEANLNFTKWYVTHLT